MDQKGNTMQTASFYKDLNFSNDNVVITPMLESSFGKEIRIAFKKSDSVDRVKGVLKL